MTFMDREQLAPAKSEVFVCDSKIAIRHYLLDTNYFVHIQHDNQTKEEERMSCYEVVQFIFPGLQIKNTAQY